jgi:hypothetical protein
VPVRHTYPASSSLSILRLPADFDTKLASWLVPASDRYHCRIGCRMSDRIHADQQAMLPLPPVDRISDWRMSVRLPRDYYVRLTATTTPSSACGRPAGRARHGGRDPPRRFVELLHSLRQIEVSPGLMSIAWASMAFSMTSTYRPRTPRNSRT